jgi:precorrin-3B synthase
MNKVIPHTVRGWCPGALRPMQSGDGLIVRLRPRTGAFALADMPAIADASARHGNGLIDLTRRANLQLRGVRPEALPALWAELRAHRLLDDNVKAEAVRNIMVSPLAGIDPTETADVRQVAGELEHRLFDTSDLWRLPAKFCFVVDGAGLVTLDNERADIRLKALSPSTLGLGLDTVDGTAWLGAILVEDGAAAALRVARDFLAVTPDARARIRDLDPTARERIAAASNLTPMPHAPETSESPRPLGCIEGVVVGVAAPFGRLEAGVLHAFAQAALDLGATQLRLSPWRTLYIPLADEGAAARLLAVSKDIGLISDAADPLLAIDACPGAPGCRSTGLDTRDAARRLAPMLAGMGCRSVHVSGCAKGCARSKAADLTLVGNGNCYGVLWHDTAQGTPRLFVTPARLSELKRAREAH